MRRTNHPARSLEFLSRLHDGELSAAERAHFESHRAHCDECRRAAAEFEETLASYRTAGTSPAAPDLAARILRRLESANPRRRPFGVVFGIDLKWAGAFTAAIVAVILGYSISGREKQPPALRVSFATPAAPRAAEPPASAGETSRERRNTLPDNAAGTAPGRSGKKEQEPAAPPPAPAAEERAPADVQRQVSADAPLRQKGAAAPSAKTTPEQFALRDSVAVASAGRPTALRITATALDGAGDAPAILNANELALAEHDRGSYVLTIAASGIPLDVSPAGPDGKREESSLRKETGAPLLRLRFAAGNDPRRLLVRIQ